MSNELQPDLALLERSIDAAVDEACTQAAFAAAERGETASDAWGLIEAVGLPLLFVPEDEGGLGLAPAIAFTLLKVVGRHGAPLPIAETALANGVLARAKLPLAEGPAALIAHTEAMARAGDGVKGRAERVAWGAAANIWVIDLGGAVARASAAQCVARGDSIAGFPRDEMAFEGAATIAAYDGPPVLALGSLARCSLMAGALERVLEMTIQHVSDRVQFGRPLSKFQAVQQQIAVLAGEISAANAAFDHAAHSIERERDAAMFAIAIARTRIGEAARRGAAIAHQLHGAMGFTREHSLQRLTRALWTWCDEFGTQRFWTLAVADRAFEAGYDGYWPLVTAA